MIESISDKIKHHLQAATNRYYRLVLLVGKSGSGKSAVLQRVAKESSSKVLNVGQELSARMLDLPEKERSLNLSKIMEQMAADYPEPLILDNLEMIFARELQQEPLRLLQQLSRNRTVVAAWSGEICAGKLVYAETGHPEHRIYSTIEVIIVNMESEEQ
jgi:predicted ATPase